MGNQLHLIGLCALQTGHCRQHGDDSRVQVANGSVGCVSVGGFVAHPDASNGCVASLPTLECPACAFAQIHEFRLHLRLPLDAKFASYCHAAENDDLIANTKPVRPAGLALQISSAASLNRCAVTGKPARSSAAAKSSAVACGFFHRPRMRLKAATATSWSRSHCATMNWSGWMISMPSGRARHVDREVPQVRRHDAVGMARQRRGKHMRIVRVGQLQAAGQRFPGPFFDLPIRYRLSHLIAAVVEPPFEIRAPLFNRGDPLGFDGSRPLGRIQACAGQAHEGIGRRHRMEHAGIEQRRVARRPRHVSSPAPVRARWQPCVRAHPPGVCASRARRSPGLRRPLGDACPPCGAAGGPPRSP